MYTLEQLIELYPDKTGKELKEILNQQIVDEAKEWDKKNVKVLAYIKDLNDNGGYFRGKFGLDQYYYYRVFNLKMNKDGSVNMSVDSVVIFYNDNHEHTNLVTRPNEIRIERQLEKFASLDTYDLDGCERLTVKEWDQLNDYLNNSLKFWGDHF